MAAFKKPVGLFLIPVILLGLFLACNRDKDAKNKGERLRTRTGVLASVNGVEITELDVVFTRRQKAGHDKNKPTASKTNVLETIIRQELFYQKAIERGLDKDPEYQDKLRRYETRLNVLKRKDMTDRFLEQEIDRKAIVSEAEAKAYFDEHLSKIRTAFHVWQIFHKGDEKAIAKEFNQIQDGTPFEEIVKKKFASVLPKLYERRPWDLGYLRWHQIPEPWANVIYNMKKGETSGIIKGPGNRFWILKLVDRRENPDTDFEKMKPHIETIIKKRKVEALRKHWLEKLRGEAEIIYYKRAVKEKELPIEE